MQFVKYKELYNNAGASLVAAAALQPRYGELAFQFPIELDLEIPLREGLDADKADLLREAIQYLTKATKMDSQHYSTYIHLISAFLLNQQLSEAHHMITTLKQLTNQPRQDAALAILEGILLSLIHI